ncbi:MAG: ABC transporter substrate-binding protein [Spirochaetia bacterium]
MPIIKTHYLWIVFLFAFSAVLPWSGCSGSGGEQKGPIVVASKIDTEGSLLGQMIVLVLKDHNFNTVDKTQFGTTDVIRKAIISGEIDIYPEYTGNGGFFYPDTDSSIWKNAEQGYLKVKELDKKAHDLIWLKPAAANNTWAIAVRNDLMQNKGLATLEDFASYVNKGGKVKLACSEEFVSRPDSLPAFEKAYGFHLKKDQLVILSGGNTAQTEKAAAEGTDGVNFAMAYGTDGALAVLGLHVLKDTLGVQPVYEPAPIVRGAIFKKYPELAQILDPVFSSLTLETLQKLNGEIVAQGKPAKDVAAEYLKSKNFIK